MYENKVKLKPRNDDAETRIAELPRRNESLIDAWLISCITARSSEQIVVPLFARASRIRL